MRKLHKETIEILERIPKEFYDYKVNDKLQLKLFITRQGSPGEEVTLEKLCMVQAMKDITMPEPIINMLINGFRGYKDMRVYDFLAGHIEICENVKDIQVVLPEGQRKVRKRLE